MISRVDGFKRDDAERKGITLNDYNGIFEYCSFGIGTDNLKKIF
jgi:uncharacterized protein YutD